MLSHIIAVVALLVYAEEAWATIARFGKRRSGIGARFMGSPLPHIINGVVLMVLSFLIWDVTWIPFYVGPAMGVITGVYLCAAVIFWVRQSARRSSPPQV